MIGTGARGGHGRAWVVLPAVLGVLLGLVLMHVLAGPPASTARHHGALVLPSVTEATASDRADPAEHRTTADGAPAEGVAAHGRTAPDGGVGHEPGSLATACLAVLVALALSALAWWLGRTGWLLAAHPVTPGAARTVPATRGRTARRPDPLGPVQLCVSRT